MTTCVKYPEEGKEELRQRSLARLKRKLERRRKDQRRKNDDNE